MTEAKTNNTAAGSNRDRTILLAGLITYGVGQSLLYIIFLPLGLELGMSTGEIGTIISISNLAILFSAPIWGKKSDVWGRRTVFVIGMVGYAVGYAALAMGIQAGLAGVMLGLPLFMGLVAARLVYGVFAGAAQPAAQAYIAEVMERTSQDDFTVSRQAAHELEKTKSAEHKSAEGYVNDLADRVSKLSNDDG